MGAWGAGSFDNDDAVDWLVDLQESTGLTAIEAAFAAVEGSEEPDAPDASAAIAAAEAVAALHGRPPAELPGEITDWLAAAGSRPGPALAERARAAVQRVRASSELKELWEESDPAEWYGHVDELLSRLSG